MKQVFLSKKDLINLIKEYFKLNGDKDVDVNINLELSTNYSGIGAYEKIEDDIIVNYEVTQTEQIGIATIKTTCTLTFDDLVEILKSYKCPDGFEYDSFLYAGGIRHVGLMVDEDTPFLEGIYLNFREKGLKKKLKLF